MGLFNALQIFIIMKTKICIKCKCEKQLFEFPQRKDSIDGRRNECKVCRKPVKSNKKYDYGKDYFKQHSKKYREANPKSKERLEENVAVLKEFTSNLEAMLNGRIVVN